MQLVKNLNYNKLVLYDNYDNKGQHRKLSSVHSLERMLSFVVIVVVKK